ncbi:DUF1868 domain-containing protein [Legionella bononiensis]|uniref:DUF1868 domain-containing protein n=1 Tax=Legionella bononiensis TaxID=2793102 RepID=A0ABS1WD36_9GAMM|nr:DUF1868 domain-containing protein [Legionella bononiensis]MBL7479128.1 DUF1868 domain-containing protein [Legionella bononiensis]MBL7527261.1 DUF1868 domain-containing protein [Legionella bononiensis]MBL7562230.1 DUF1868 domain-containing protein [Legionella bononiensis]
MKLSHVMMLRKYNNKGEYTPFPGLTVVASVQSADKCLWSEVNRLITECTLLDSCYAPLSYTSYHMTALNLFTEQAIGSEKWKDFIISNTPLFKAIRTALESNTFCPEVTIDSLKVSRTIKLVVRLPSVQKKTIDDIAQQFELTKKIPHPFHITLAYRFKMIDKKTEHDIELQLNQSLEHLLIGRTVVLNPPELCFFNDMKSFIPWDVSNVPFNSYR